MKKIELSEQDVVSFGDLKPFNLPRTNKFSEFREKLEDVLQRYSKGDKELLDSGIDCEVLRLGSQKWDQGRLKISVEFIPSNENSDISESTSILNEFRGE